MAIIGNIEEINKNYKFNKLIKTALEYLSKLEETDFKNIKLNDKETIKLNGSKIFAINSVYKTKNHSEQKFEGHRKYIDLQFVFSGEENIKISSIKNCIDISEYDPEKDVQFFDVRSYSTLLMKSGMIAIFYPEDIHAPGLDSKNISLIKKSVIKVMI
ncbi:MAG: YhcH/YjgK/YiaL family protein [bacterium]|nr:YhcH/YjgK/YiaL family protein [bacterium]